MNNNINKMINVMDDGINNIASKTGLTVSEANELISTVCKFMISKKDDSDKAEMASFVSSINDYILRIKFMISYLNEQIGLLSGSPDSTWKIMYLISELFQSLNSAGNKVDDDNINEIFDAMNFMVNNIASETGLTVPEAYELISIISKFMIGKKDDSAKAEMFSSISSMNDHNLLGLHLFRIELILSYTNERIGLISGSSDSAWKVMYLISELFQSLNSVGNKVDDDSTNKNNQSDEKTELKNIINELKELAEFFDIAVISAHQLNRVGASVVDTTDDKKSLIDLSSCAYIGGFDTDIDFLKIKMNNPAVVIRAGYGNQISQKDEKFEEYYKNAKDNGLKVGAYWYSYARTSEEAIQEVRAFLHVIAGKQFDIIVFDIEQNYLLNNTSVIEMRTEIITLVRSYCNMYGYNVQFITLNEDGRIVTIDNVTN